MQKQQYFSDTKNNVQFISQIFQVISNENKFVGQNNSIGQKIENLTSFLESPDTIIEFKELKQYSIGETNGSHYCLCKFDNNKIITSHKGENLGVLSFDENTFRQNKKLQNIQIQGLNDIEDKNYVNCVKNLRDNSMILCCTNKPKIII